MFDEGQLRHFLRNHAAYYNQVRTHLWASIPDSYLIYSRSGFNQSAIDRIRRELETTESAQARQIA